MLSRSDPPPQRLGDGEALAGDLHPLLRRLYAARGVRLASELDLALESARPGRPARRHRRGRRAVVRALPRRAARIVVIGDFDADGATSTALVVRQLRRLGFASIDFLVPNRFEYGYGLTPEIVRLAAQGKPALIVTVDNGISSHAGVAEARALGIDTLITDHHLRRATLPAATAHRESECAGRFVSEQGARGRRRRVLSDGGADARDAGARSACGRRRRWRTCSIWSRSARSPISCRSIATTACSCIRGCGAFAPVAACRRSRTARSGESSAGRQSSPPISAFKSARA